MIAEREIQEINKALYNIHIHPYSNFDFRGHLQTICAIAKASGDFETKLTANRLGWIFQWIFGSIGTGFFCGNNFFFKINDQCFKNGVETSINEYEDSGDSTKDEFLIYRFDVALAGINLQSERIDDKVFSEEFKKLHGDPKRWRIRFMRCLMEHDYLHRDDGFVKDSEGIWIDGLPILDYKEYFTSLKVEKSYKGIATKLISSGYIENASDDDIKHIIECQSLLTGRNPIDWIDKKAHLFDFCDFFKLDFNKVKKCFHGKDGKSIERGNQSQRKNGYNSEIVKILAPYE